MPTTNSPLANSDLEPSPERAGVRAASAFATLRTLTRQQRAATLRTLATALESHRSSIIAITAQETALTPEELAPEFARMTGTLELFASVIERHTHSFPAIDHKPGPERSWSTIGPANDLRSSVRPLGPVAVFGASNFPLAYGVCGGDTASALAAGCSVVVKEHPAHRRTGQLLASIAHTALLTSGLPVDTLVYLLDPAPQDNPHRVSQAIVAHPTIRAIGFTGSVQGGLAIESIAQRRVLPGTQTPDPIPAFCEMGSVNPVVVTAAAASARADSIANSLAQSVLSRFGQQCTCPGLLFVAGNQETYANFREMLIDTFRQSQSREMLSPGISRNYTEGVLRALNSGATLLARGIPAASPTPRHATPALLEASPAQIAAHALLRDEIFGPAAILIPASSIDDGQSSPKDRIASGWNGLPQIYTRIPALTWSVFAEPSDFDDPRFQNLIDSMSDHAGRLIFNGVPTGLRVGHATVHGGPMTASNRADTTAVGPRAIGRFCRPICYQNFPQPLLPPELRDQADCFRLVDGTVIDR